MNNKEVPKEKFDTPVMFRVGAPLSLVHPHTLLPGDFIYCYIYFVIGIQ